MEKRKIEGPRWIIMKFYIETMRLGMKALPQVQSIKREYSTLNMNVSKKGFLKVKNKLIQTRKEIIEMTNKDSDEDRVYQLNVQLFPVTQKS